MPASESSASTTQVNCWREVVDPTDFYAPVKDRFRVDPRRIDDPTIDALLAPEATGTVIPTSSPTPDATAAPTPEPTEVP